MIGVFYEYKIKKWDKVEKSKWYTFLQGKKRKYFGLKNIKEM